MEAPTRPLLPRAMFSFKAGACAVVILLAACSIPMTYYWYWPEASWGELRGRAGSVPTPTISVRRPEFPHFGVLVYVKPEFLDERPRGEATPILVLAMGKDGRFFETDSFRKKNKQARVQVQARSSNVEVELSDGTSRVFKVPELSREIVFVGEHTFQQIEIPLHNVKPQSLVVRVPSFVVNGQPLETGAIKFRHEQTRRWVH